MKENKNKKSLLGVLTGPSSPNNNPFTCAVNKTLVSLQLFGRTEWPNATSNYIKDKATIKLFPNPAGDEVVVQWTQHEIAAKSFEVSVYDENGQKIESKTICTSRFTLDTSGYKNGIYFIRITHDNEEVDSKFIVKHGG